MAIRCPYPNDGFSAKPHHVCSMPHRRKFHKRILSILIGASLESNSLISQDPCGKFWDSSTVECIMAIPNIWKHRTHRVFILTASPPCHAETTWSSSNLNPTHSILESVYMKHICVQYHEPTILLHLHNMSASYNDAKLNIPQKTDFPEQRSVRMGAHGMASAYSGSSDM